MTWALDNSEDAEPCDWMAPACRYTVTGPRSYQLAEDWWCLTGIAGSAAVLELGGRPIATLSQLGRLDIRAGFAWDGPSGPTYDTADSMAGSLAHDALYRMRRHRKIGPDLRDEADELAYRIWRQSGMRAWRARLWYRALRKFAGPAWDPHPDEIITVAAQIARAHDATGTP
jgi:hypothetical protein